MVAGHWQSDNYKNHNNHNIQLNMADEEKKLSLDNQHFSKFAIATLTSLYEDKDFTDVTLVWENTFYP